MCSLLFLVTSASAQSPPADKDLIENPIFQANCAKCHGKTAEGRHFGGPSLVSGKIAGTSTADLRNIVTSGKGRMPKYASKLTSEQIDMLVQQIKTLNNNK
jgi:mono/diheme cytochrome c family protein